MGKLPRGNRSPSCWQRDGRIQVATVPCKSIYASSHETQFGPERVKTRSHWELTKSVSAQVAAFRLRQPERQITAEHIAKAQQPRTGVAK